MPGIQIGLKDLHYRRITDDTSSGVTYNSENSGKPISVPGIINAKITPSSNTVTLYADDGPDEVASALGEIALELTVKDLDLATQAALLGHTLATGVLTKNADDVAPYVAIGFKSLKSNGKYRYTWLYKGKFNLPEQNYKTKEENLEYQPPTITGVFVKRVWDDAWQAIVDEEELSTTPEIDLTEWFDTVYVPNLP